MESPEEVMEILEAFELTGTLRDAAELAGCDHKTVAHRVRAREEAGRGLLTHDRPAHPARRPPDTATTPAKLAGCQWPQTRPPR